MAPCFRFRQSLQPYAVDDDRVFLVGERDSYVLQGRLYNLIAPLVDGRTSEEIDIALDGQATRDEIDYVLELLRDKGYLSHEKSALEPEVNAYWHSLGIEPFIAEYRLKSAAVAIEAFHGLDPAPLQEALSGAGVDVAEDAPIHILLVEDYLCPELEAWNHRALQDGGKTGFLVKPVGTVLWIGPVLSPGNGVCWECLAQRLRWNRPVETYVEQRTGQSARGPSLRLGTSVRAGLDLAALQIARWIAGGQVSYERLITLDLGDLRIHEHPVERRPQCLACGDANHVVRRALSPPSLVSRPVPVGSDRTSTVEQIDELYSRRHVSPITGIISNLGPMPGSESSRQPAWGASLPRLPQFGSAATGSFDLGSWGRGSTIVEARATAVCEALERYSMFFHGDEPRVHASLGELGPEAVGPQGSASVQ